MPLCACGNWSQRPRGWEYVCRWCSVMQIRATASLPSTCHYVYREDPQTRLPKAEAPFWVFPSDRVYRGCGGASDRRQEMKAGKVTPPTGSPKDTLCLMLGELGCLGEGEPSHTQVFWELVAQVSGELYLPEPQMEVPLVIVPHIL